MIVDGRLILINFEHPSNECFPIEVIDVESSISINDEQPQNACDSILWTVDGIEILLSDSQL